jgi:lipid-A-disaccharide synthase
MFGVLRDCHRILDEERPGLVVVIDSIGFNLYVSKAAKQRGIPVLYYISPQLWAHGAWRVKKIKRLVDKVVVIYPFEEAIYQRAGVPVRFVGHPLVDELTEKKLDEGAIAAWKRQGEGPLIALLPGSRRQEIRNHAPIICDAVRRIRAEFPSARFVVACADESGRALATGLLAGRFPAELIAGKTSEAICASTLCLTCSGTATLDIAFYGKPMVILYRIPPLGRFFSAPFMQTPFIGLPNAYAGREIAPEFLLCRDRGDLIAEAALALLKSPDRMSQATEALAEVRAAMGDPGASRRAAEEALALLSNR